MKNAKNYLIPALAFFLSACDPGYEITWEVRNHSSSAITVTWLDVDVIRTQSVEREGSLGIQFDGGLGYAPNAFESDSALIGSIIDDIRMEDTLSCKKDWNDGKNWRFEGKKSKGVGVFFVEDADFQ
ncbi:MAG: hypothetical protein KA165_12190 [Saprospiraceae bacterium]|nr:hypothetical protein [Saprospiraceae bacterium]